MNEFFGRLIFICLSFFPLEINENLPLNNENTLVFEDLKSYIKKHEGLRLRPYKCAGGYMTIGYGHVTTDSLTSITIEEAELLLQSDVFNAYLIAVRDGFTFEKAFAVAHFIYSFGSGAWKKSKLRRLIKNGASKQAIEDEWLRWVHINKKSSKYLYKMRKQELKWFFLKQECNENRTTR